MQKFVLLLMLILLIVSLVYAKTESPLNWITFTQAESLSLTTNKYILVNIYKPTCRWCRKMERITYSDPNVIAFINENFLPVKLNIIGKGEVKFNGVKIPERELALAMKIRGTPTTVFMDSVKAVVVKVPGYVPPNQFIYLLKYVSSKWYEELSFEDFYKSEKVLEKKRGNKK